jgi:hypothetical protein
MIQNRNTMTSWRASFLTGFYREFGLHGSYVLRRPIRYPALRWDSRNPRRNHRTDVGGEICSPRNFDSASVAKECAQVESPSLAAIERDSQRFILTIEGIFRKAFTNAPSPQSSPRRRGEADTSRALLTLNAMR